MFHKFASIINTDSGSISFTVGNHNLFEETVKPITIDSVQVNGTEFLLQRDPDMKLVFQHTSPKLDIKIRFTQSTKINRKYDPVHVVA
jgi:hypothetical protein